MGTSTDTTQDLASLPLEVVFLDVGHGFCTILITPGERRVVMVDCKAGAGPSAIGYLRDHDLDYPTAVYVSHLHDDHIAGFADVFRHLIEHDVPVERVYLNFVGKTTRKRGEHGGQAVLDQLEDLLDGDDTRRHQFVSKEADFKLDGVSFSHLHPTDFDLRHQDRANMLNDLSGVLRVEFGRASVLLPGDIQAWGASCLVSRSKDNDPKSRILLFPHHGAGWEWSGPSGNRVRSHKQDLVSPDEFVGSVSPAWTVISVGWDNDGNWPEWGHPSEEVLQILRQWHASGCGGLICTEATRRCDPDPGVGTCRGRCGGNIRLHLYNDGRVEMPGPEHATWQNQVRRWRHPQCTPISP